MILVAVLSFLVRTVQVEPELIGIVYRLEANTLVSLERVTATVKSSARLLGFAGARQRAEVKGERASVRVKSGQVLEFILRSSPGVDPTRYKLYRMDQKNGKREMLVMESAPLGITAKVVMDRHEVSTNISAFSPSSVRIVPIQPLGPGEYCFSPVGVNDVFCFGVDLARLSQI